VCVYVCLPRPGRLRRGKVLGAPIVDLLPSHGGVATDPPRAFYTAALNEDVAAVVDSAVFGAGFTPHLKVKVNADVAFW
jgi:hypothetical protein